MQTFKNHIIGYHGTTLKRAKAILHDQKFLDSTKENEWLGKGVYFFEYDSHAKWWITTPRYEKVETRILQATLEYTDSQLIDLDDPSQMEMLDDIMREATGRLNEADINIKSNISKCTLSKQWCLACNLIKQLNPQKGIVIYTFPRSYTYPYSCFPANQRQICVSDHSIIRDIKEYR